MSDLQNRIVGIVGRKGSGKSTRTATLLKYVPRIIVWDPMADHRPLLPDSIEGLRDELADYLDEAYEKNTFACSYVPGDDLEWEFDEVCELVYDFGNLLFVVEEAPLVCKAGHMPPRFGKLVRTGRHRGLDILWTAQRASEVSRTLTSATDFWIFYSQTEPRDLDAIAERCGREIAAKVAELGLHDFFVWDVIARKPLTNVPRLLKREIAPTELSPDLTDSKS
jgi:hypothetical protein